MAGENDLSGSIGLDITKFRAGVSQLTAQMKNIETEFRASATVMDNWSGTSEGLKTRVDSLNDKLVLQKSKLSGLTEEFKLLSTAEGDHSKDLASFADQMNTLERQIRATEKDLSGYTTQLKTVERQEKENASSVLGFKKGLSDLAQQSKKSTDAMRSHFGSLSAMIAGFSVSLVAGLNLKSLVAASETSEKVAAQQAAVLESTGNAAGMTADQLNSLAASQSKVTTYTAGATKQAENMLLTFTNVGSSVFPDAIKASEDMATAMGMSATDAAKTLGKALNDPSAGLSKLTKQGVTFTDEQKEQIKAMQAAGDTAGAQKIIIAELAKEFGGSAQAAGATLAGQIAIAKNNMTSMGVTATNAIMPIVTSVMPSLTAAVSSMASFVTTHKGDIQGAVSAIGSVIKGVFGFISDHGEIVKTAVLGIAGAIVTWKVAMAAVNVVSGVMNTLEALKAARLGISNGLTLAQTAATKTATDAQIGYKNALIAEGIVSVQNVAKKVASTAATVASTVATKAATAAQWLLNAAMDANPVGIVILAVAALTAAFIALYKNNEAFRNLMNRLFADVKSGALVAINGIKSAWNGITGFFSLIWNGIKTTITTITSTIVSGALALWNGMKSGIQTTFDGIKNVAQGAWEIIKNVVLEPVILIRDIVTGNFGKIKDDLGQIWNNIKAGAQQVWDGIKEVFSGELSAIQGLFSAAWGGIKTGTETVWGNIKAFFTQTWSGLKSGVTGWFSEVKATISQKLNEMWEATKNWIGSLPAKISAELSKIRTAITNWETAQKAENIRQFGEWWNDIKTWISSIPSKIGASLTSWKDSIVSWFTATKSEISNKLTEWWTNIGTWFTSIPTKLGAKFSEWWTAIKTWFDSTKTNIGQKLNEWWSNIGNWFSEIPSKISAKLEEWWTAIKQWFSSLGSKPEIKDAGTNMIKTLAGGTTEKKQDFMDNLGKIVVDAFEGLIVLAGVIIASVARELIKRFIAGIKELYGDVKEAASGLGETIRNKLSELPAEAIQWGKDFINGLVGGIRSGLGDIKDAASTVAGSIKSFLHFSRPDEGPLRDYESWMPDMMKGFAEGIIGNIGLVANAAKATSLAASTAIKSGLGITNGTSSIASAAGKSIDTGLASGITDNQNIVQKSAENLSTYLTNKIQTLNDSLKDIADDAQKAIVQKQIDVLTTLKNNVSSTLSEVDSEENSLKSKLSGLGSLVSTAQDSEGKSVSTLTDLGSVLKTIQDYSGTIAKLKAKGVSPSMLSYILNMDPESAIQAANMLLALSDSDWKKEMVQWDAVQSLSETVSDDAYSDALSKAVQDDITKATTDIKESGVSIGTNIVDGLVAGINNKKSVAIMAAEALASAIKTAMQSALGIASPSKVMRDQVGKWIPEGVAAGITGNLGSVRSAMSSLSGQIVASSTIKTAVQTTTTQQVSGGLDNTNAIISAINALGNKIASASVNRQPASAGNVLLDGKNVGKAILDPFIGELRRNGMVTRDGYIKLPTT